MQPSPRYRLGRAAIPILRDPLTVADEISAEVHRAPTVVRLEAFRRDQHLFAARSSLIAAGLSQADASRLMDEAERLSEAR